MNAAMDRNARLKTAIIILNWNGWDDTRECLESLLKVDYPAYRVIVVDNGSTDGSPGRIREWISGRDRFEFIETGKNLGYARGNNLGIKRALSDPDVRFVMVLNNDTAVDPAFLTKLVEAAEREKKAVLFGPRIVDYESKRFWRSATAKRPGLLFMLMFFTPLKAVFSRLPLVSLHSGDGKEIRKVYAISGSCMFFRSEVLKEIGMFDESTFLGWEEFIVAEKLRARGHDTLTVPDSIVYHKWGASTKKLPSAEKAIEFLRSEKYFNDKYLRMPLWQRFILNFARFLAYLVLAVFDPGYRRGFRRLAKALFAEAL